MKYAKLKTHSSRLIPMANSYLSAGPAVEITEDGYLLDVMQMITKGREGFLAFPVDGASMIECIPPGSIVFVDTWCEARSGDIVAVNVNGEVCIKVLEIAQRKLYLVPRSPDHQPREVTKKDSLHVLGVVKGSLKMHG